MVAASSARVLRVVGEGGVVLCLSEMSFALVCATQQTLSRRLSCAHLLLVSRFVCAVPLLGRIRANWISFIRFQQEGSC